MERKEMKLAQRMAEIKPSSTLAMAAKANKKRAQGIDVVDFGLGEPDFRTPAAASEAAILALREGYTKYTPTAGSDELKDAILSKLQNENQLSYSKEEIIVSCGAKHTLYNIAQVLFERGDEVIIPAPFWVTYPDQVRLNDATPVIVYTHEKDQFLMTKAQLQRAITPRTKAVIINSPCNPTGSVYTKEQLQELADLLVTTPLWIISDEIYEHFIYDGKAHVSIASLSPALKKKTIVVNGVSKSYSMTGFRIGYAAGPKEVIGAMTTLQSQTTSCPTSISQKAAIAALKEGRDFAMVAEYARRRQFMVEQLNGIAGISCIASAGSFYLFPNVIDLLEKRPEIKHASDLAEYLLEEAAVATVPGEPFGMDGYLRLSYAVSQDTLAEGMLRMSKAIAQL
jgi:aspartate aminotransferase